MSGGNVLLWIPVVLLIYSLGAVVAFMFTFKPQVFVRRQASTFYKQYKEQARMTDEEIDHLIKPFWFLFMIDSMSHFVNKGVEHPEEFRRLMLYYRAVGGLIWAMLAFAIFLIAVGFFSGALSITK